MTSDLPAADHRSRSVSGPESDRPASDPAATVVARMFADLFELDQVGPDDDFFRLGGDSLMAESLISEVERSFGAGLSVSALVRAPTPRRLAALIMEQPADRRRSSLLPVRPKGSFPPLFCVHGMSGTAIASLHIARAIRAPNAIYGFRAQGLEEGERPLTSVRSLAAAYLALVRSAVQPAGPYLLLGHCGGSMIAYEMAQMLIAAGETVGGLILIDPEINDWAPFLHHSGLGLWLRHTKWTRRRWALSRHMKDGPPSTVAQRRELVRRALTVAVARYRPKPIGCRTLLICTLERRDALLVPARGYRALLPEGTFAEIGVRHDDIFRSGANALASACEGFLKAVGAAEPVGGALA